MSKQYRDIETSAKLRDLESKEEAPEPSLKDALGVESKEHHDQGEIASDRNQWPGIEVK